MNSFLNLKSLFILVLVTTIKVHAQRNEPSLNYASAQAIIKGCLSFADSAKLAMAVAVFDSSGELISFARMDGASLGVSKVAEWKGKSAAIYQFPTSRTAQWNVPTEPDISTAAGGLPIFTKDDKPLGGVGVSGAAASVDVLCAEAGLRAAGLKNR